MGNVFSDQALGWLAEAQAASSKDDFQEQYEDALQKQTAEYMRAEAQRSQVFGKDPPNFSSFEQCLVNTRSRRPRALYTQGNNFNVYDGRVPQQPSPGFDVQGPHAQIGQPWLLHANFQPDPGHVHEPLQLHVRQPP